VILIVAIFKTLYVENMFHCRVKWTKKNQIKMDKIHRNIDIIFSKHRIFRTKNTIITYKLVRAISSPSLFLSYYSFMMMMFTSPRFRVAFSSRSPKNRLLNIIAACENWTGPACTGTFLKDILVEAPKNWAPRPGRPSVQPARLNQNS